MIKNIVKQIEESNYWDARVRALECNYFGDEVKLVFENGENNIIYHFESCYKIVIEHCVEYSKDFPSRELSITQIPYFMQDVEVKEITLNQKILMEYRINMHPIKLFIVCEKFSIG